jgi:hypothetical protein
MWRIAMPIRKVPPGTSMDAYAAMSDFPGGATIIGEGAEGHVQDLSASIMSAKVNPGSSESYEVSGRKAALAVLGLNDDGTPMDTQPKDVVEACEKMEKIAKDKGVDFNRVTGRTPASDPSSSDDNDSEDGENGENGEVEEKAAQRRPKPRVRKKRKTVSRPVFEDYGEGEVIRIPGYEVCFTTMSGTINSHYHSVFEVKSPIHQLVLVWDTRYVGTVFTPNANPEQDLGVSVRSPGGSTSEYSTRFLGFGFTDENKRYTILLIK